MYCKYEIKGDDIKDFEVWDDSEASCPDGEECYPTYSHRLGLALHLRYQDPFDHSLVFFGVSAMVYYCTAPQSMEH